VQNALGTTKYGGVKYSTVAENVTGLLAAGSVGVNHGNYDVRLWLLMLNTMQASRPTASSRS
jgi:hypothetical protein